MTDDFYRQFEERYRGSRELIKGRLRVYLPFIQPLAALYPGGAALDLGCGRGEWLELMAEHGVPAHGVDLDEGMLQACRERGLHATAQDALAALRALPPASQVVVSGFHIAEHLPFADLKRLVQEALRVLVPAGLLILETPNPENLLVGTSHFYLDPTHQRPLPPPLLSFLAEHHGFARVKVVRVQEDPALARRPEVSLQDVWGGASPDYAVVAQAHAPAAVLALNQHAFEQPYGLTPEDLLSRFDRQRQQAGEALARTQALAADTAARLHALESQARQLSADLAQAVTQIHAADALARQAIDRSQQAEFALRDIYRSRSWRITAPLRLVGGWARLARNRARSCAARCKPFATAMLQRLRQQLDRYPRLKRQIVSVINRFPRLKRRLQEVANPHLRVEPAQARPAAPAWDNLTPYARIIYDRLAQPHPGRDGENP